MQAVIGTSFVFLLGLIWWAIERPHSRGMLLLTGLGVSVVALIGGFIWIAVRA